MDRREFLEVLAVLGAGPLVGCGEDIVGGNGQRSSDNRVVVLGGGLAGLTAAYELMREGFDVILLEGQNRVGGRVLTVRDGFEAGGYAEMGAARIFSTHSATLKYVNEFGLEQVPYDAGQRVFYMRGQRFRGPAEGTPWPVPDMSEAERADPFAFLGAYLGPGFGKLGEVFDEGWPNNTPSALELDKLSVEHYLRDQGASAGWVDWFRAMEGNVKRLNACAALATEAVAAGADGELPTSIRGGNDQLPLAFAAALGDRVKLNCKVVRLEQRASEVTVTYLDAQGEQKLVRGARCVCALPFSTLRQVTIATPFSDDKMRAIQNLRYLPIGRCYFQTQTRFWQHDTLGPIGGLNLVGTDTFAGRIWNTSSHQPDPAMGMIHSYMFDVEASEYAALPNRIDTLRQHISDKLLPGLTPGQVVATAEKLWQDDPWVGGGWGWTDLYEMRTMHIARRRAEGRIHFAGEHTSVFIAWMNGAIESGARAANEILAAEG